MWNGLTDAWHPTQMSDVRSAVAGVDYLYTDAWLSMGEPAEDWDARIDQLPPTR